MELGVADRDVVPVVGPAVRFAPQAVEDRERKIETDPTARARGGVERRTGRRRGAIEPPWFPSHAALEELANNAEGVLALELAGLSSEHVEALVEGRHARRNEKGGLAHTGAALDDDEATETGRRIATGSGNAAKSPKRFLNGATIFATAHSLRSRASRRAWVTSPNHRPE